jgi:hypothetical protein
LPVPVNGTLCGEPAALSVATRLALAVPGVLGLKAMERVQLAPAGNEFAHVEAWIKNSLAPESVKNGEMGVVVLVLVTVSVCAAAISPGAVAGKERLVGEKEIVGMGSPMPVRATLCGEPVALSVATRLALAVPGVLGLKAIERVQLAPGAREFAHVEAWIKNSFALAPKSP